MWSFRSLMASALAVATLVGGQVVAAGGEPSSGLAPPVDRPFPGKIELDVDASDVARRIVHVRERISGLAADSVLLYPQWLPGAHAPEGPLDRLAGLRLTVAGQAANWVRDRVNVNALHVHKAGGDLLAEFDYLSPTSESVGAVEMSADLLTLEWNAVVLYPAGYYARQIPVSASLTVPEGWHAASALEPGDDAGARHAYRSTTLEMLIDSPVYAGRYATRFNLDPEGTVPVRLNVFADRPDQLVLAPAHLSAYRALVQQAYKLFGSHHYAHYDFLYSLSDQIQHAGLEHHQSSEDGASADAFTEWDKNAWDRDLLAHEFTHSWNGKFRRPADLWTPNYNVPMQDSLLWVYEGQTEYWGNVLAARSGLRTHEQALEHLAQTAAFYQSEAGRSWRSVADTTNDEIINPRRPMSWPDWQRFEDYYDEGALIWLEADTLIRQRSHGQRSLDDFARAFFGIDNGRIEPLTYTFEDVVRALQAVEPYDWSRFLHERIDEAGRPAPLAGIEQGGYRLVFDDIESHEHRQTDEQRKRTDLRYSLGIDIDEKDKPGTLLAVAWGGPAFRAGLTEGAQILAVNGAAYTADGLKAAVRAAHEKSAPLSLIVRSGDRFLVADLPYHDGLRYPHLVRTDAQPALLDAVFAARP